MALQLQLVNALFIALSLGVVFLPKRGALLAWLVTANLTGIISGSYIAVESVNYVALTSALVLPVILLVRFRHFPSGLHRTFGGVCWVSLASYAFVASAWSPEPLSGMKMCGHLAGIFIEIMVLERAVAAGFVDRTMIFRFAWASLLLAGFRSLMAMDGDSYMVNTLRFGSYVTAQQYAALLAALLVLVLWEVRTSGVRGLILASCLMGGLILNGSRTWALGAVLSIVLLGALSARKRPGRAVLLLTALCVAVPSIVAIVLSFETESANRIVATVTAFREGDTRANSLGLGTYRDRQATYEEVLNDISSSDVSTLFFGHGTSSGGRFTLGVFSGVDTGLSQRDPNRSIHNEWLRALYEWGVVGLILTIGVVASIVWGGVSLYSRHEHLAVPLLAFLPSLCLGLSTENIFAGAGNAATMGAALVLARTILNQPVRRLPHRALPAFAVRTRVALEQARRLAGDV